MTLINHRSNGRHEADISIPARLANAVPNTKPLRALLVDDNDEALTGILAANVALIDIMFGAEFGFEPADTLTRRQS